MNKYYSIWMIYFNQKVEISHIKVSQIKSQKAALNRDEQFDLIYAIVEILIFEIKSVIVWFSMRTMRLPLYL